TQSTSSCSSISFATRTCLDGSASATRSCDAPSTTRPPAAGGWVRTSGAPRRLRRGEPRRRRGPTTASARPAGATSPPWPACASAIEELPDQGSPEGVALMTELAVNLVWRAKYEAMQEWAERAVNAARRLGDAPLTAAALAMLTLADSMMGAAERAEANRREATALVDSLPDDDLARHLESATRLAGVELYLGRYADGEL